MPSSRSAQHRHPLITLFCLLLLTTAWSAPLPVSELFEHPALALPKVSANGKLLALRAEIEHKQYLALMDLSTMKLNLVAKFDETELLNIFWKGDDLLLLLVQNSDNSSEFRSYDLKTQKVKFLSAGTVIHRATMLCPLPREADDVIVQYDSRYEVALNRLNTRTGKFTRIEKASSEVKNWIVDNTGKPIAAACYRDKEHFLLWRKSENHPWERRDLASNADAQLMPFGVHPDQRRLLAWDPTGTNPKSLIAIDPDTMKTEVIFQSHDVDPDRIVRWGDDPTAPTAVFYENDRPRLHFFDAENARIQASIDAALPETFNLVESSSNDMNLMVIWSSSPRDAGGYYILDRHTGHLISLGPNFPHRPAREMGTSQSFSFKSREGLKITGRLLLPPGNPEKPPVVLLVGGFLAGPRSRYMFDVEQQLFATRGYAVVRIDFRGCSGFGRSFIKAGDYQFATGIVDDLLDGLDYLETKGLVDSSRVALFTNSWGGIVGVQALTRSDRFKLWLNKETFLAAGRLKPDDLSLSSKKAGEVESDLGGKMAAQKYLASLEPENLLPQINIPSFHIYTKTVDALSMTKSPMASRDSFIVVNYLKKHPGLGEVINPEYFYSSNQAEAMEKMLAFLMKKIPPALP